MLLNYFWRIPHVKRKCFLPLLKVSKIYIYKHCVSLHIPCVIRAPLHHIKLLMEGVSHILRNVDVIGLCSQFICSKILLHWCCYVLRELYYIYVVHFFTFPLISLIISDARHEFLKNLGNLEFLVQFYE